MYLRKAFTASGRRRQRLYITAKGLYTAWLNGKRIGDMVLAPGSFTGSKHLGAQTYDVTRLLHAARMSCSLLWVMAGTAARAAWTVTATCSVIRWACCFSWR